jgi:hypothetical protein
MLLDVVVKPALDPLTPALDPLTPAGCPPGGVRR